LALLLSWPTVGDGQQAKEADGPDPKVPILTLTGHTNEVYTVVVAPDGKHAASATNTEVKCWDLATGREVWNFPTRSTHVYGLAYSPDGKKLAVGITRQAKVLDAENAKELLTINGQGHYLFRMVFSPDGKHLAISSGSSTNKGDLCVWESDTGKEALRISGLTDAFLNVSYSADGKRLVTASGAAQGTRPGEVKVWDAATGKELQAMRGHAENVYALALSPNGRSLASGAGVKGASKAGELKLWETGTGKEVLTLKGHTGPLLSVAFSPDGRRLASASGDKTVRLWDAATGQEVLLLPAHMTAVYSLAFTPNGKKLVSAGGDRTVKVWDVSRLGRSSPPTATSVEELTAQWADLGCDDARQAYRARAALVAAGAEQGIPVIRAHLKPVALTTAAQQRRLTQLMTDIDDPRFAVRQKAVAQLIQMGEIALAPVRKALADKPPLDVRRHLERVAEEVGGAVPGGNRLLALRAVEVLEHWGTPDAQELLKELASGLPEALQTQEARAALERLGQHARMK